MTHIDLKKLDAALQGEFTTFGKSTAWPTAKFEILYNAARAYLASQSKAQGDMQKSFPNPNNGGKDLWLMVMADPGKGTYTVHAHGHNCCADYRTNPFFCGWIKINMGDLND